MCLLGRLIPGRSPHDTEVFIQKFAMQPLVKAGALRPDCLGGSVFDCFQLEDSQGARRISAYWPTG